MLKPRFLGSLILLYLGLYKLWEFIVVVMGARPSSHIDPEGYLVVLGHALIVLYGLVLLSYLVGGASLFLRRRWSAVIVFYSAVVEATILLLMGAALLYATINGSLGDVPPFSVLPFLLLLVFPAGFGYAARNLRNKPELWQAQREITPSSFEPTGQIPEGVIRPGILQKAFWTVVATGVLLPAIMALVVMAVWLIRGKAFHIDGDDLFVLLFGAFLFALPYIVLAFVGRTVLRGAFKEDRYKAVLRSFVFAGIFFGMTATFVPHLYYYFDNAEFLAVLIFAPFAPFMLALPGIVAGAIVGLIAHSMWKFFRRSDLISRRQEPRSRDHGPGRRVIGVTIVIVAAVVSVTLYMTIGPGWEKSNLDLKFGPIEPEMVRIEGGRFWMGSDPDLDSVARADEQSRHQVSIDSFYIGKYEVTFEEYDSFVRLTYGREPDDDGRGRERRPVVDVSWKDAVAYAEWLSEQTGRRYRLPTEAEWEYAARAGTTTVYWWGNDIQQDGKVWANCKGCGAHEWRQRPAPVGSFEPNAFGVYDTAGNIWEWVQDCWYGSYEVEADRGPVSEANVTGDCNSRVFRGGSWFSPPFCLRSTARESNHPDTRALLIGFRLAREIESN